LVIQFWQLRRIRLKVIIRQSTNLIVKLKVIVEHIGQELIKHKNTKQVIMNTKLKELKSRPLGVIGSHKSRPIKGHMRALID